jgi:hypothetical protein
MFPAVVVVVEPAATTEVREPRSEANNKPFLYVKRLKKNLVHQLKRFAEGFEDFDLGSGTVHGAILDGFKRSNQACCGVSAPLAGL